MSDSIQYCVYCGARVSNQTYCPECGKLVVKIKPNNNQEVIYLHHYLVTNTISEIMHQHGNILLVVF